MRKTLKFASTWLPSQSARFRRAPSGNVNSMTDLLYKCMTKATTAEGDQCQYGPNWVVARRGLLKVYADHLECGDYVVNYSEIIDAKLQRFKSSLLRIPGYILSVKTEGKTYHFGLNGWGKFWKNDLPFHVDREDVKLKYSAFSLAVRLILIGYLLYWAWRKFV